MNLSYSAKSTINQPSKPCHNCRRRRLRCDRSRPGCHKCSSRKEECLGYGKLLRWTNTAAVRSEPPGRFVHQILDVLSDEARNGIDQENHVEIIPPVSVNDCYVKYSLVDPLLQDLGYRKKLYLNHFSTAVCQDLVSFDQNDHSNPFRSTITLTGEYDFLREIILATSAIHIATLRRSRGCAAHQELADALLARGTAYRLLRGALSNLGVASHRAIVMIAVVFFINFDLIDSGQGSWMPHMKAAGNLVSSLRNLEGDIPPFITQLADVVVADCLTYHILGSALGGVDATVMSAFQAIDITSTLQKAAVHSYHCCPPFVLGLLARACKLSVQDVVEAELLVHQLRTYDVEAWVHSLDGLPATDDLEVRVSLASAHRAAACLYVVLVVPDVLIRLAGPNLLDPLVHELFSHLSAIPVDHALAKGVIWPTFLAGAQAEDVISRQWCLRRMQTMWYSTPWICPWGYIESAIGMMQGVWKTRDQKTRDAIHNGPNWLQELRGLEQNCLIV